MGLLDTLLLVASGGVLLACLTIIGTAMHAYYRTRRPVMLALSVGFTFVIAGTLATVLGLTHGQLADVRLLLTINHGFSMVGITMVAYGLLS